MVRLSKALSFMLQAGRIHDMIKRRRQLLQQKLYAVPQGKRWTRKPDPNMSFKHQVLARFRDSLLKEQQEKEAGGRGDADEPTAEGEGEATAAARVGEVGGAGARGGGSTGAASDAAAAGLDLGAGGPLVVTSAGNVVLLPNEKEQQLIQKLVERIRTVHFVRKHSLGGRGPYRLDVIKRRKKRSGGEGRVGGEDEGDEVGVEGEGKGAGKKGKRKGRRRAVRRLRTAAEETEDEREGSDGDEWGLTQWDDQGQQPLVGVAGLIAAVKGTRPKNKPAWWARHSAEAQVSPTGAAVGGDGITSAVGAIVPGADGSSSGSGSSFPSLQVAKAMELMLSLLYQSELVWGAVLSSEVAAALTLRFQGPVIAAAFAWLRRLGWMTPSASRKPFRLTSSWRALLDGEKLGLDWLDGVGAGAKAMERQLKLVQRGEGEGAGEVSREAGGPDIMDVDGGSGELVREGGNVDLEEREEGGRESWMVPARDDGVWCTLKLGQLPKEVEGSVPLQLIMGAAVGWLGLDARVAHSVRMGEGAALMQARALLDVLVEVKPAGAVTAAAAAGDHAAAELGGGSAAGEGALQGEQQQEQQAGVAGEAGEPLALPGAAAADAGELGLAAYQCPHWLKSVEGTTTNNAARRGAMVDIAGMAGGHGDADGAKASTETDRGKAAKGDGWSAWEVGGSEAVREAVEQNCLAAADAGEVKGVSAEGLRALLGVIRSAGSDGIPLLQLQQQWAQQQEQQGDGGFDEAAAAGQGMTGSKSGLEDLVAAAVGHVRRYGLVRVVRAWWEEMVISSESSQSLLAQPTPKAGMGKSPAPAGAAVEADGEEVTRDAMEQGGSAAAAGEAVGAAGGEAGAVGGSSGSAVGSAVDAPVIAGEVAAAAAAGGAAAGWDSATGAHGGLDPTENAETGAAVAARAFAAAGGASGRREIQLAPWLDHKGRLIEPFWQELVKRVMKLLLCNPGEEEVVK